MMGTISHEQLFCVRGIRKAAQARVLRRQLQRLRDETLVLAFKEEVDLPQGLDIAFLRQINHSRAFDHLPGDRHVPPTRPLTDHDKPKSHRTGGYPSGQRTRYASHRRAGEDGDYDEDDEVQSVEQV
jgi:hypothetical protein